MRVVPNKFPAFRADAPAIARGGALEARAALGRQEVVVHTPRHAVSLAELTGEELDGVAEAWRARALAAAGVGFPYVHALVNEGRAAGASLAHSHSQLVWLPEEPPAVAEELRERERAGGCTVCSLLARERESEERIVLERDGLVVLAAFAGRQPYELLLAPLACEGDPFGGGGLAAGLRLAAETIRRLRAVEGAVPLNLWLHARGHWHLEVVPRLTTAAGLELGAGLNVNPLPPEEAAQVLRAAG